MNESLTKCRRTRVLLSRRSGSKSSILVSGADVHSLSFDCSLSLAHSPLSSVSCTCTECTVCSDRRAENCALSTEVIEPDLSCSDEYTEPAPQWSSMH
ncbi:hypothetical protein J6590_017829 [Homalodisca vitripennis]|nr:hypothetical protein J6590_017829 [Homalodisca vitripennis]